MPARMAGQEELYESSTALRGEIPPRLPETVKHRVNLLLAEVGFVIRNATDVVLFEAQSSTTVFLVAGLSDKWLTVFDECSLWRRGDQVLHRAGGRIVSWRRAGPVEMQSGIEHSEVIQFLVGNPWGGL